MLFDGALIEVAAIAAFADGTRKCGGRMLFDGALIEVAAIAAGASLALELDVGT